MAPSTSRRKMAYHRLPKHYGKDDRMQFDLEYNESGSSLPKTRLWVVESSNEKNLKPQAASSTVETSAPHATPFGP